MIDDDVTLARPRTRRMLPAVGEVMREASARSNAEPEVVFRAARQVCSDELRRIKDGHESAPIETLVQRTLDLLRSAAPGPGRPAEEEVFTETTGALDLRWEGEAKARPAPAEAAPEPAPAPFETPPPAEAEESPFEPSPPTLELPVEPPAAARSEGVEPFLLDEAAVGSAAVEAPAAAPVPSGAFEIDFGAAEARPLPPAPPAEAATTILPLPGAEAPTAILPASGAEMPTAILDREPTPSPDSVALLERDPFAEPPPPAATRSEIGEDTLSRLSKEAASVDLASVLPGAVRPPLAPSPATERLTPDDGMPYAIVVQGTRETVLSDEERFERSDLVSGALPEAGSRRWPIAAAAAGIVAAAVLGWYLFGLLKAPPSQPAPVLAERPAVVSPSPVPATPEPVTETPPAVATAAPVAAEAPPASTPVPVATAPPSAAPPPPEPVTRIAVPVVRETPKPAAPAPVTRIELPKASPAAVERVASAPAASPAAASPSPAPQPARQGRAAGLATPDWAGKESVFALHFTSYPDRKTAEKDAAAIGRKVAAPVFAVGVDLGPKGVWYRVMAGEFRTFEEAQAFRDDVVAQGKIEKVGFVYRLEAAKEAAAPPEPR